MKAKIILFMGVELLCAAVLAEPVNMPSKGDLKEARSVIEGLVEAGTSAEELLEMSKETDNGAERYYLYQHAYILQAKAGKYDAAAEILKEFQTEVSNVPASDIVNLIERHSGKKAKDIPQLAAALKMAKAKVSAEGQVSRIKKELKKSPGDASLRLQLAESLAIIGSWSEALNEFKKVGGGVGKIAEKEVKGDIDSKLAAFWWDYVPKNKNARSTFKAHAVGLYSKLLEEGELSAIEKALAEKRVIGAEELGAEEATTKSTEAPSVRIIANTNGLVHRWTFNDTLADECGDKMARLFGNAKMEDGRVRIYGGNGAIDKVIFGSDGKVIPVDGSPLTLEIWVAEHKIENWSRIFSIGQYKGKRIDATWSYGTDANVQELAVSGGCALGDKNLMPFELNKEYHLAFILSYKTDLKAKGNKIWYYRGYKQDAKTGKTLGKFEVKLAEGWSLEGFPAALEIACFTGHGQDRAANASYNEVRVWKRALSEGELTDNAKRFYKAGETMKK